MKTSIAILVVLTAAALPATAMAQQEKKAPVPVAVGDTFPRLEAEFLSGRKAVLPDAAKGKTALVLMGFTYDSGLRWRSGWRASTMFTARPRA